MKILIDNGHGINTPGKCSPDGRHKEWAWSREMAQMIVEELVSRGYDAQRIVTETTDISLRDRTRRVNDICKSYGATNCLLISVHNNAAGADGQWHNAKGWSVWIAQNASTKSKKFAQLIYDYADKAGLRGNRSVPTERYWVASLAIVRDTNCPAVLTENLFQDNEEDVDYLQSSAGKHTIAMVHVNAIIDYIKSLNT